MLHASGAITDAALLSRLTLLGDLQDPTGDFDFERIWFWVSSQDPMGDFDFASIGFWVSS